MLRNAHTLVRAEKLSRPVLESFKGDLVKDRRRVFFVSCLVEWLRTLSPNKKSD